ncbi:FkbM family methyltransferase [Synechococcus sp. AH-736-G21]|nr:FkbM family methyltransferase [Synechococcus sp. AH-736-G21]
MTSDYILIVPANNFYISKNLPQFREFSDLEQLLGLSKDEIYAQYPLSSIWKGFASFRCLFDYIQRLGPDLVLDIGAFAGIFSIAANIASNKGDFKAFEPNPENIFCTLANFKLNKCSSINLIPAAIADKLCQVNFEIPDNMSISGKISKIATSSTIAVPSTSIDLLFDTSQYQRAVAKIDVEGYEPEVLSGMKEIISRQNACKLLIMEYHPASWISQEKKLLLNQLFESYTYVYWCNAWQFSEKNSIKVNSLDELTHSLATTGTKYCDLIFCVDELIGLCK